MLFFRLKKKKFVYRFICCSSLLFDCLGSWWASPVKAFVLIFNVCVCCCVFSLSWQLLRPLAGLGTWDWGSPQHPRLCVLLRGNEQSEWLTRYTMLSAGTAVCGLEWLTRYIMLPMSTAVCGHEWLTRYIMLPIGTAVCGHEWLTRYIMLPTGTAICDRTKGCVDSRGIWQQSSVANQRGMFTVRHLATIICSQTRPHATMFRYLYPHKVPYL